MAGDGPGGWVDRRRVAGKRRAGPSWSLPSSPSLLAAYSLTLPHTPPKTRRRRAADPLAWREAIKLLGVPFVGVLVRGHLHR